MRRGHLPTGRKRVQTQKQVAIDRCGSGRFRRTVRCCRIWRVDRVSYTVRPRCQADSDTMGCISCTRLNRSRRNRIRWAFPITSWASCRDRNPLRFEDIRPRAESPRGNPGSLRSRGGRGDWQSPEFAIPTQRCFAVRDPSNAVDDSCSNRQLPASPPVIDGNPPPVR